jgi:hypothetical protein
MEGLNMDLVYFAGPGLVTIIFAYFAMQTDSERHPAIRLMFLLASIAGLLVLMDVAQAAATYGEVVINTITTVNETQTFAYTHVPPITSTNYDMIWLIVSVVIWLVFIHTILGLLAHLFEWFSINILHREAGLDEIG